MYPLCFVSYIANASLYSVTNQIEQRLLLKNKSGVYKIIVKKQPYQLLNTNREFVPNLDTSNFHKLINESS